MNAGKFLTISRYSLWEKFRAFREIFSPEKQWNSSNVQNKNPKSVLHYIIISKNLNNMYLPHLWWFLKTRVRGYVVDGHSGRKRVREKVRDFSSTRQHGDSFCPHGESPYAWFWSPITVHQIAQPITKPQFRSIIFRKANDGVWLIRPSHAVRQIGAMWSQVVIRNSRRRRFHMYEMYERKPLETVNSTTSYIRHHVGTMRPRSKDRGCDTPPLCLRL